MNHRIADALEYMATPEMAIVMPRTPVTSGRFPNTRIANTIVATRLKALPMACVAIETAYRTTSDN